MSNQKDFYYREFVRGRISRREFIGRLTAAGVALAAIPAVLANAAKAAAPKSGGHLRIGFSQGSTSDSTDPTTTGGGATMLTNFSRLGHLTVVNADGELEPSLAESFEAGPGAIEWTFDLRRDVEFHSGKTLDADDVIGSIANHLGEDSKSALKGVVESIEEMRKDGDHRVIFRLREGNADFPFVLSASQLGILPAKDGAVDSTSWDGTGAYAIEEFDPGVRIALKRHPNYFKDDVAFFDSAEFLIILDGTARQNALVTGEVDVINQIELKTVEFLESMEDIEVLDVPGTLHFTFPMRTDIPPFDNNDVRLALKYAIDREQLLRKILRGHGTIGNDHPISRANRFFAWDLPQRTYDPDKARFHLKKAGMENLKVELSASDSIWTGALDAVVLYREHAAKAGIEIVPNRVPNDGYWSNTWMKDAWCASYWSGRPTEDWMFSQAYAAEASWNETFWKHDRFDVLLRAARAELDESKRREMYGEMQLIVRDEGGAVIPLFSNFVIGVSTKVAHSESVAGNWDLDGLKILERWWFA